MAGRWTGPRITKRLTSDGVEALVKHRPGGEDHDQSSHGRRDGIGVGSREALLSVLTAARDRFGVQVQRADRLRGAADSDVWDEASKVFGSYEATHAALGALPQRNEGEALRAEDVPDGLIPAREQVEAERARLRSLKTTDGRPAQFILHGTGSDGRPYARPVGSLAEGRSPEGTYLLADGVWSVGSVRSEPIR